MDTIALFNSGVTDWPSYKAIGVNARSCKREGIYFRPAVFVVLWVLFYNGASAATDLHRYKFNIPSMSANKALNRLAQETDTPILYRKNRLKAVKTNPLIGEYLLQEALELLLHGTVLRAKINERGVITVALLEEKEMNKDKKGIVGLMTAAVVGAGLAQPQIAHSESMLEEIVVSARRYEENLQDAPVAVNAMSGEFLEEQGIGTVDDVILNSPGASFTQFNKMQAEYGMRGVSSQTEGASGDSSVSTIIDNVVVSKDFMKNPAFYDMERVEVLRGPQGTAFGRNASSGLIHLITAKPEEEFSGGVTLDVGSHGKLGVEGHVTGALSDTASGRLAFNFDSLDGYTEDQRSGADLGGEENVAFRASIRMYPSDTLEVYVKAEYNRDNDDSPAIRKGQDCNIPYQDAGATSVVGAPQPGWQEVPVFTDSCDPWETTISDTSFSEFYLDRELINFTAEVTWEFAEGLALTSVTGYMDGTSQYFIDAHGGPNNSMFQNTTNDANMFSQEFRIDNQGSGNALRWLAGIYYMTDEHARFDQNIFYAENAAAGPPGGGEFPPGSGNFTPMGTPNPEPPPGFFRPETRDIKDGYSETDSLGLFGEITYDVSDQLSITGGLRYSKDEKDYSIAHYGFGWGGPLEGLSGGTEPECVFIPPRDAFYCGTVDSPVGFVTPVTTDDDWSSLSTKLSLTYSFGEAKMLYLLLAQGYKTGGFQPEPRNPEAAVESFDKETVDNFELGFKGDFGDNIRLNLALFYTEYDDLQLFLFKSLPSGAFTQVAENAAGVEIKGIEGDWIWAASERLQFSGGFAITDAELTDALIDTDGDGVPEDFSGTQPDNTSEWTTTFVVSYDIPLESGAYLKLRADWRGNSEVFDDIGEQEDRKHDSYEVIGARVSWTSPDESWGLTVWGRNLTEEEYTTNVGPAQPNINQLNFGYGAPRTFGATVNVNF